jgi:glycogen operon protein
MYLDGRGLRHRGSRGELIVDDSFLLLLHSGDNGGAFTLPGRPWGASYEVVVDTSHAGGEPRSQTVIRGGADLPVGGRTSVLLRVQR